MVGAVRAQAIEMGSLGRGDTPVRGREKEEQREGPGTRWSRSNRVPGNVGGEEAIVQAGISVAEFFRMKKQMDELQAQLHSTKAMLQVCRSRFNGLRDMLYIKP